jgi:hypothetical protein
MNLLNDDDGLLVYNKGKIRGGVRLERGYKGLYLL